MKKLMMISAIAGCLAFTEAEAQTVNGVRLTELKSTYIEIFAEQTFLSTKTHILVDYGQKDKEVEKSYIKDDDGKKMEFNSGLDGINKLRNYGYELFQVYLKPIDTGRSRKYYILKKR